MRGKLKVLMSIAVVMVLLVTSVCSVFASSNGRGSQQPQRQQQNQQQYNQRNNRNNQDDNKKQFSDVNPNFWAYPAINTLTGLGIFSGNPDGTFKPNAGMTRSEFATVLALALDLKADGTTQTFTDVPATSWDYRYVQAAAKYLTGYLNTATNTLEFKGTQAAAREDMAVALVKALNLPLQSDNGQLATIFKDASQISSNLKDYVYTAYVNGIMVGSDSKFKPQASITRAEAAQLLLTALEKTQKVVVDGTTGQIIKVPSDGTGTTTTSSTDATLSGITYNGVAVPAFSATQASYSVVLPAGTTSVTVAATTSNAYATKVITQASAIPGTAVINVVAQDGVTHSTYVIYFSTANSTDATLSALAYNGISVPSFSPSQYTYSVVLPVGTTVVPTVTAAVAATGRATAVVTQATTIPGVATINVVAQDGVTHRTYTITFTATKSSDATLSSLAINGVVVTGFTPSVTSYNYVLPAGTTVAPAVTAVVNAVGKAAYVVIPAPALPGTTTVRVTAEDGTTVLTYSINFTLATSTDATLKGININGVALQGFASGTYSYNQVLSAGTAAIPVVTVQTNDATASASVIQATGLPGAATIVVTADDGTTKNTYTVYFTVSAT